MSNRTRTTISAFLLAAAACLPMGVPALAQVGGVQGKLWATQPTPPPKSGAPRPFTFHWSGITKLNDSYANNWKIPINWGPAQVRQDVKIINGNWIGNWPTNGAHVLITDSTYLSKHLAAVPKQAAVFVDDPNWDGMVMMDHEAWIPIWERYPKGLQEKFRAAVRAKTPALLAGKTPAQAEAVFKSEFQRVTKDLYLQTLAKLRTTWPRAKFAFLYVPPMLFGMDPFLPPGTMGYGDKWPNPASDLNDSLAWLVDAMDFLPAVNLPWAVSVTSPDRGDYSKGTIDPVWNWKAWESNIKESVRLARTKPVYMFFNTRYAQDWGRMVGKPPLNNVDLNQALTAAMMNPAVKGAIFWDEHFTPQQLVNWENYIQTKFWPAAQQVAAAYNVNLIPVTDPLPTWPNVGNLARTGNTKPARYAPTQAIARFQTAVNANQAQLASLVIPNTTVNASPTSQTVQVRTNAAGGTTTNIVQRTDLNLQRPR
jgi:hypothetical protein